MPYNLTVSQSHEEIDGSETPDAIFPNNWISFHEGSNVDLQGTSCPSVILYPMMSPIRRMERQPRVIEKWTDTLNARVINFTHFEEKRPIS